jgi:hypothetical protein
MPFRNGQLPYLSSYAEAVKHHDSVKPIRNRHPETRPLGLRRRDEATIVKHADRVECWLYKTPVVTFASDGTITITTDGYNTQMTASMIDGVLYRMGVRAAQFDSSIVLYIRDGQGGTKNYRVFDGMQLKVDNQTGRPIVLNPKRDTYHIVDRAKMAEVRKNYKPFIQYMTMMNKVCDKLDITGIDGVLDNKSETFMWEVERACKSDDLEQMLYLYKRLASTRYLRHGVVITLSAFNRDPSQFVVRPAEIKRNFDRIIKTVHAEEVFGITEAPEGEVRRDDNQKYFN